MSHFTPAMDTAARQSSVLWFAAIEFALPSRTVRLLDGATVVSFGGRTFGGIDDVFGTLGSIDGLSDGVGDTAPQLTVTLYPPSASAVTTVCAPTMQGSAVSLWVGIVNPITGQVVADPDLRFVGELDVPTLKVGRGTRSVAYTVVSAHERFFDDDEGVRLNDAWHSTVWPGERGLQYVSQVTRQLPWGSDAPRPANVTYGGSASGGASGPGQPGAVSLA